MKKIPETDAIFENVAQENQKSDVNPKSLRLSIDSKAKVKIGELSREGKDRTLEPRVALDHDMNWTAVLVPFGILNTQTDQLSIYFGQSAETSDFIVDCLAHWCRNNQAQLAGLDELVIDLDGGGSTRSDRKQFCKRLVDLSRSIGLRIRLIYYPPYHSKYNPIERCWAVLEKFWNGAILDSIEAAIEWASRMAWNGIQPIVYLVEGIYEKGVKVLPEVLEACQSFWKRSDILPKWDITITPH